MIYHITLCREIGFNTNLGASIIKGPHAVDAEAEEHSIPSQVIEALELL